MVTRIHRRAEKGLCAEKQKLSKEALVRSTRVKSETEKRKFVKKYFDKPQNTTKSPNMTTRPEKSDAKSIAVPMHRSDAQPIFNGSLTPGKRSREMINIFGGGKESPAKRPKLQKLESKRFSSTFKNFGEGSSQLPLHRKLSRVRTPSESADVILPADTDLA